jgi:uncharacterized membrane protein YkgB
MATITPTRTPRPEPTRIRSTRPDDVLRVAERWLARHSITMLRVSVGLIFLGFGALKFIPGASPAEALAQRTVDLLTFGIVSGTPAVLMTAVVETTVGILLITGIGLRFGLVMLGGALTGIMSPLVLFPGDLFDGMAPTLEAQYILKNVVVACAGLVVAASALGARYVASSDDEPAS